MDVRAIDGEASCQLDNRPDQFLARNATGARVSAGQRLQVVTQGLHLRPKELLHHLLLSFAAGFPERCLEAREAGIGFLQGQKSPEVDETAVQSVEQVVPCRAGDRPVGRQRLIGGQNFFRNDIKVFRRALGRCRNGAALQAAQIAEGIIQAVDVVNPQAGYPVFPYETKDLRVPGGKNLGVFHAQSDQVADVEEAPVVHFFERRFPVSEPIGLVSQQPAQAFEARTIILSAAEGLNSFLQSLVELWMRAGQFFKPLLQLSCLRSSAVDLLRVSRSPVRELPGKRNCRCKFFEGESIERG